MLSRKEAILLSWIEWNKSQGRSVNECGEPTEEFVAGWGAACAELLVPVADEIAFLHRWLMRNQDLNSKSYGIDRSLDLLKKIEHVTGYVSSSPFSS